MQRDEIETIVREWIDMGSKRPDTGLPPDAKVRIEARKITTFGHLKPGQSAPDSGMDVWSVEALLFFPERGDHWDDPDDLGLEVAQVLGRLEHSLGEDPSLGTPGVRAHWRGTDSTRPHRHPAAPAGYPCAVEVHVTLNYV